MFLRLRCFGLCDWSITIFKVGISEVFTGPLYFCLERYIGLGFGVG